MYESESGNAYKIGYLKESGWAVDSTGKLPSYEKANSKSSTSDIENFSGNIVEAKVTLHAADSAEWSYKMMIKLK